MLTDPYFFWTSVVFYIVICFLMFIFKRKENLQLEDKIIELMKRQNGMLDHHFEVLEHDKNLTDRLEFMVDESKRFEEMTIQLIKEKHEWIDKYHELLKRNEE